MTVREIAKVLGVDPVTAAFIAAIESSEKDGDVVIEDDRTDAKPAVFRYLGIRPKG